ncbi:MAG: hypothetical protein R6W06_08110 [Prochlorococcaceae cyanobacterium]
MALDSGVRQHRLSSINLTPPQPPPPERFRGLRESPRSAWSAGVLATLLAMAAEWLDLALHGH